MENSYPIENDFNIRNDSNIILWKQFDDFCKQNPLEFQEEQLHTMRRSRLSGLVSNRERILLLVCVEHHIN